MKEKTLNTSGWFNSEKNFYQEVLNWKQIGYGRMMQIISEHWRLQDPNGVLPIGYSSLRNSEGKMNEAIDKLFKWYPESLGFLEAVSRINYPTKTFGKVFAKGDDKQPFFSEAYLYNLLGKEDARTLRALLRNALMSLGISEGELDERL